MNRCKILLLTSSLLFAIPTGSLAAGACCALTKCDTRTPSISVVGANSWGDLMTDDDMYSLSQQAMILKLSIPVINGLSLQGQIGAPIRTALGMGNEAGYGGFMFGVGAGYSLPEIANRISFAIAGSASRSYSFLGSPSDDSTLHKSKDMLIITEGAGFLVADVKIVNRLNLYGGINLSMDATELENDSTTKQLGEAMMMLSPLVGIRWTINDRISTLFEAGFGHNNVLSFGITFPFDFSLFDKKTQNMSLGYCH